ncbi:hypothetical protein BGK72_38215 [Streptomyces agglomeratus]|nr:hypothetical protein BGK72_38215 [Streptomyces agglomeratus]
MTDAQLTRTFELHFQGQTARDHWRNSRESYLRFADGGANRRTRQFARVADRSYDAAVAAGPAVSVGGYFVQPTMPGQPPSPA